MTALRMSQDLLNIAPLVYFLTIFFEVIYWIKPSKRLYWIIPAVASVALAAHTTALGIRWIEGGLYRPPWTNLYESLVYFAWGLAVLTFVTELRNKIRYMGMFTYALVFIAMGLAYFTPAKDINPLVPSLQSWWILAHSFLAAFAYSGLVIGSVFSFLYLIKVGLGPKTLGISGALLGLGMVLTTGGGDLLTQGVYQLNEMIFVGGSWVKNVIPGSDPREIYQVALPPVAWMLGIAGGLYLIALLSYVLRKSGHTSSRGIYTLATLIHVSSAAWTFFQVGTRPSLTWGSSPYHLGLICFFVLLQLFFVVLIFKPEAVAARLPSAERLDRLAFSLTFFGFPFMTLILITGAIWAHEAWGRYWGWDPKETTALVTWLIYAAYVHARRTPGWSGRKAALISILGFFSVLFTYLGANLVLSGLHSYGAQ